VLVTGSSGLIGSKALRYFDDRGARIYGVDNNMRADFEHRSLDIRDRGAALGAIRDTEPELVIRCAAQPSHDLAGSRPFDDFDVNALLRYTPLRPVFIVFHDSFHSLSARGS
jgi:CDP-paratose 2-epimerase